MRTKSLGLCAVILLITQTVTFAQKTEVSVQKGKVVAETANKSLDIEAGRKAVLAPGAAPVVSVDNPLVEDALELYKLAEKEKERSNLKIESVCILVVMMETEELQGACYFEFPNYKAEATNVMTIGVSAIMEGIRVYDMKGNLCRVELKKLDETAASYSFHFSEAVQPGEHFRLIGVADLQKLPLIPGGIPIYEKEGFLSHFRVVNNPRNCLNYYRLILPESAILVDCNREILATDTVDGRLAVTIRNYTGPYHDGWSMISFLWPDEDGTSLADIPDEHYGLRSKWDRENSETYNREMKKILAGKRYEDQSTPPFALLTCYGSIINDDFDLYAQSELFTQTPETFRDKLEQDRYWVGTLDVLSTSRWPINPGNGYVHPIYLCRKGSMIREFMLPIVYEEGQWYVHSMFMKQHFGAVNKFEKPTDQEIAAAEAEGYLTDWQVAGPYIRRGKKYLDKKHNELFDISFGPELTGVDVPWRSARIEPYEQHPASVNIAAALYESVSYLHTEIVSNTQKLMRLEIYTDDGVKAWLNDKLIHTNNVTREIPEQPDTVNVTLQQGANHLMLKVTEYDKGSRAIVRLVEP